MKIDSADMRIALWAYVGMLGVTSLMQALEIRAQNFNNLPESHVMAYVLIWAPWNATVKHRPGPVEKAPWSRAGMAKLWPI